jgi:hypothetical protein
MPKNYTLNASCSVTASSDTGYSQSQTGSFNLNLTGIDQVHTGRVDCTTTGGDAINILMAAVGYGRAIYVRNLDETNFVTVYNGASSGADPIGVLEPGEFLFTVIRSTTTTVCVADTATCTVEYFAVEIDSAA